MLWPIQRRRNSVWRRVRSTVQGYERAALNLGGVTSSNNGDRLRDQRRALPDAPGVYLFKDAHGRALYVGKAKSIRKRVASHFSARSVRGADAVSYTHLTLPTILRV